MEEFRRFLRENVEWPQPLTFAASARITDEKGEPVQWRIIPIDSREDSFLRDSCMRWLPVRGGEPPVYGLDKNQYFLALAVHCTEYPDLNSAELQDNYGVLGAGALLQTLLNPGEYLRYVEAVQNLCGYGQKREEELEKAAKK